MSNSVSISNAQDKRTAEVDALLRRGLDFYGKGFTEEAVDCWKNVLKIDAKNAEAHDYLETAGAPQQKEPDAEQLIDKGIEHFSRQEFREARDAWNWAIEREPGHKRAIGFLTALNPALPELAEKPQHPQAEPEKQAQVLAGPSYHRLQIDKKKVVKLLQEKKYDELLEMLFEVRDKNPDDEAIKRSIALVENRITLDYAKEIGGLDQIPTVSKSNEELVNFKLCREQAYLLSLIDGMGSLEDVFAISGLASHTTYSHIRSLIHSGLVVLLPAL